MEHHVEVRHPEGSSIATVKNLLDNPHIQLQMIQLALSAVITLFTPSKLTPSAGSDDPVATNNPPVGSASTNVETSDINRELSTYKDRLALELTNFKKQLETQSHIEVECVKQNLKSEFDHKNRHQTLTQTKVINALRQQIDLLRAQLWQQQVATCPLLPQAPPLQDVTLPPQPPPHHYNHTMSPPAGSLVEVMDVLNRSMTSQYAILQETLRQLQSASKEHYLINVQSCDGKNPQEFGMWLDKVSWLATICNNNPMEVALAISRGNLHKYINKLVLSGLSWSPIKAHIQERFSECRSVTMAKNKLTQLKQSELPMHEYIAKFGDMAEHAYSIKATDSASTILASSFIEGVQNPHVKNRLRSYQVKNLKDISDHGIQEDQKQMIRVLDFGLDPKLETMPKCSINAIRDKGCFKCGNEDHFVKDCPLSQPDKEEQKGHYTDHRNANNTDSATDKVMEPLSRFFTDLVAQLKLLTP